MRERGSVGPRSSSSLEAALESAARGSNSLMGPVRRIIRGPLFCGNPSMREAATEGRSCKAPDGRFCPFPIRRRPMLNRFLTSIFGSRNERVLRQLGKVVSQINALEPKFQAMSDAELRAKTDEFRDRLEERRQARQPDSRGVRDRARGIAARARPAPLRRAADRRHGAAQRARSPRCAPARARRWSRRCRCI